jgi:Tfp pilus assembly protein PilF
LSKVIRLLLVVVVLEVILAAAFVGRGLARPSPPMPEFNIVNSATAADIKTFREDLVQDARLGSDDAAKWSRLADVFLTFGFFRESERCYRYSVSQDPSEPKALYRWGVCLERMGKTSEAIERFRQLSELGSGEPSANWHRIGVNYLREEKAKEAEDAFVNDPSNPFANFELAKLMVRSERVQQAVPLIDGLLQAYPESIEVNLLRARAEQELGNHGSAAEYSERADRGQPILVFRPDHELLSTIRYHFGLGALLREANELEEVGNLAEASAIFYKALEVQWSAVMVRKIADIEIQLGRGDAATEMIEKINDRVGTTPESLLLLGRAHWSMGRKEKARETWARAAWMRCTEEVHSRLATYYESAGDQEKVDHHRGLAHFSVGIDSFRSNDLPKALDELKKAVELVDDHADSWFYLGEVYRALGRAVRAQEAYNRCQGLDPTHGRVHRGIQRLTMYETRR